MKSGLPTNERLVIGLWTALLAVIPWVISPGVLLPDTKTDLIRSPAAYLQRATEAWNFHSGFGDLQNQAYGYFFPLGPWYWLVDVGGLPAWVGQRAWWSLILGLSFAGVALLVRTLLPVRLLAVIAAGMIYALSPRVLTVLTDISVELWPGALAPWLLLLLVWTVQQPYSRARAWRFGGTFALLVAALSGVNATVSLVALLGVAIAGMGYWREFRPWAPFLIGAMFVGAFWWIAPLLILGRYSYPFMDFIETSKITTAVTSVPNTLRGANHWVAYILDAADHPVWQSGWVAAQDTLAIVGGLFLVGWGLLGLGLIARQNRRLGRVLLVSIVIGVVGMSLGYMGRFSFLGAHWVRWLLDGPLNAARNVHKLDLLVRIPLAFGVGAALHWATSWPAKPALSFKWMRQVGAVVILAAFLGSLAPVWTGRMALPGVQQDIPHSFIQAGQEIDALAAKDGGMTLVLPNARVAEFTWGRTTDEPLGAVTSSPVAFRAAAPLSTPGSIRVMDAVDAWTRTGDGMPGLGDFLRRAGIYRIAVRAGLAEAQQAGDPHLVEQALRSSGLQQVAVFGSGDERVSLFRVVNVRGGVFPARGSAQFALQEGDAVSGGKQVTGENHRGDSAARGNRYEQVAELWSGPESLLGLGFLGVLDPRTAYVVPGDPGVASLVNSGSSNLDSGDLPRILGDTALAARYNNGRPVPWSMSAVAAHPQEQVPVGARMLPPGDRPALQSVRLIRGGEVTTSSSLSNSYRLPYAGPVADAAGLFDGDFQRGWVTSTRGDKEDLPWVRLRPSSLDAHNYRLFFPPGSTGLRPQSLTLQYQPVSGGELVERIVPVPVSGPLQVNIPATREMVFTVHSSREFTGIAEIVGGNFAADILLPGTLRQNDAAVFMRNNGDFPALGLPGGLHTIDSVFLNRSINATGHWPIKVRMWQQNPPTPNSSAKSNSGPRETTNNLPSGSPANGQSNTKQTVMPLGECKNLGTINGSPLYMKPVGAEVSGTNRTLGSAETPLSQTPAPIGSNGSGEAKVSPGKLWENCQTLTLKSGLNNFRLDGSVGAALITTNSAKLITTQDISTPIYGETWGYNSGWQAQNGDKAADTLMIDGWRQASRASQPPIWQFAPNAWHRRVLYTGMFLVFLAGVAAAAGHVFTRRQHRQRQLLPSPTSNLAQVWASEPLLSEGNIRQVGGIVMVPRYGLWAYALAGSLGFALAGWVGLAAGAIAALLPRKVWPGVLVAGFAVTGVAMAALGVAAATSLGAAVGQLVSVFLFSGFAIWCADATSE